MADDALTRKDAEMKAEQIEELAVSLIDAAPMYHTHIRVLRDLALHALSLKSVREEVLDRDAIKRVIKAWTEYSRGIEYHPGSTAEAQAREVDIALKALEEMNEAIRALQHG